MKKKGQGLGLNVVIVAAIALVVMVVLVLIFTGQARKFGGGLADCASKGGVCSNTQFGADKCPVGYASLPNTNCDPYPCCISYVE